MSKQLTNPLAKHTKQERRRERREELRRREEARLRTVRNWRLAIAIVIAVLIIAGSSFAIYALANSRTASPSATAPTTNTNSNTSANAAYPPLDNIACEQNEQLAYHIHVHLSLYMNGAPVNVPANIGIATDNSCIYWLHVHRTDGIIHIEAPTQKIYTLGNFFHVWSQRFPQLQYPVQLESTNDWQVFVDGKPYTGDFHAIPLAAHTLITMGYKSPAITPDTTYSWGDL
ncbi:MAG: hypothetical protein E6J34_05645 [Chloroflexi bacterium]|nr:MAG: hypothetical protein E6J34_05645 [Chloroflexota bacterium]